MQFLKQSTAATINVGLLLNTEDNTVNTAANVTAYVLISKNGGAFVSPSGGGSSTASANGVFTYTLSSTDTNTLGRLDALISGYNPPIARYQVVPANVFDSLVGGSDKLDVNVSEISEDSTAADTLETYCDGGANIPADVVKISGDSDAADNAELMFDGTGYAGGTTKLQVVDTVLDAANTELSAVPNTAGTLRQMIQFLFTYFRNKKTVTSDTETLFKENASDTLGTATLADNGTTYTRGEMG